MINELWITDAGTVQLEGGRDQAASFAKEHPGSRYIAFHTDAFSSGWEASLPDEFRSSLLEIRIFTEDAEYHLFRTSTGNVFQYRIAEDSELRRNLMEKAPSDPFLRDPENYRLVTRQILDINTAHPTYRRKEKNEKGCRLLTTTGGGHYALPLEDEQAAVVVRYLRYDEKDGVARVADERLAGFEPLKGGESE